MFQGAQAAVLQKIATLGASAIAPVLAFFLLPFLREHVYPRIGRALTMVGWAFAQAVKYALWRPMLFFLHYSLHGLHYVVVMLVVISLLERTIFTALHWYNQHYNIAESHLVQSSLEGLREFVTVFAAKPLGAWLGRAYETTAGHAADTKDFATQVVETFYERFINQTY